jgi:hypothetical protein
MKKNIILSIIQTIEGAGIKIWSQQPLSSMKNIVK